MKDEARILYNAIRCPDGSVIESWHRHDFVQHRDKKTGKTYMVDGGLEYLRRSTHDDQEELAIHWTPGMPHEILREYLKWGSYGKDNKGPIRHIALCDMDTDHINAVLDTQKGLSQFYAKAFIEELNFRGEELK